MWENEHKKAIIRNIVILVVLAAAVVGLRYSYQKVRRQIAMEDAQLGAANQDQRQELIDSREENLEAVQREYEADLEAVNRYMPGIVCWGDSLTAGTTNNVSYPSVLQKYINAYICGAYDLRYSLANPNEYTRVNWNNYKISIPVVNMGAGQENSDTILGYAGVAPYVVKYNFVIPAGKEPVKITFTSPSGKSVTPLTAGDSGMNPVTINGVEGTLSMVVYNNYWQQSEYQFTRSEEGEPVSVNAGTEIIPAGTDLYRDYIHIIWIGTYDRTLTPEGLVNSVKQMLARQAENSDRFLVIGPCTFNGSWTIYDNYTLPLVDAAMQQAFGSRYINLRKYLIEEGLRDAGMSGGGGSDVPSAFRSSGEGADLNSIAYPLVGKLVYDRMVSLGYFDEIRNELNLDKATQDILKYDPTYFEKLLAVS